MSIPMDLAVYDSGGQLAAVVEVKSKRGTSRTWAAEFRRNLLTHGGNYRPIYFLIVTPDRIYLWKNAGTTPEIVGPDYEIDARPIFKPYLDAAHLSEDRISGGAFEIIVMSWLNRLTVVRNPVDEMHEHEELLLDSGLLDVLRDGRVEQEIAV